jgi:hypothetical protein
LPGILLLIFTLFLSVLVALATLLFRNALIIALVIFSPLALIAWVLPGTQKYWKYWTDNFMKLLLLFPLMITIIWTGRIFAYIAGGLGAPGFLDLLAVLVGFFAPYFIIFKAFKWGGSALAAASNAISNNGAIRKSREVGKREFGDWQKRNQGKAANAYDLQDKAFTIGKGKYGLPKLGGRAISRIGSGSYLPTERSRRLTIAKGDEWAGKRNDEAEAYTRALGESARLNGYINPETGDYVRDENGEIIKGTEGMKLAFNDIAGNDYSTDAQKRAARLAVTRMRQTQSWIEFQHARVTSGKNKGRRIVDLPVWRDQLNKNPDDYGAVAGTRPDFAPDVIDGAEKKAGITFDQAYADPNPDSRAAKVAQIDKARLSTAIDRLTVDSIPKIHFGMYQDIERVEDEIKKATGESAGLADALDAQLQKFAASGQHGHDSVSSLLGGREKQVNGALARASRKIPTGDDDGNERPLQISDIIAPGTATQHAPAPAAPAVDGVAQQGGAAPAAAQHGGGQAGPAGGIGGGAAPAAAQHGGGQAGPAGGIGGFDFETLTEAVARGTRRGNEARPDQAVITPHTTRIETQGGVLEIPHQPGETISPGGVILPRGPAANAERERQQNPPEQEQ